MQETSGVKRIDVLDLAPKAAWHSGQDIPVMWGQENRGPNSPGVADYLTDQRMEDGKVVARVLRTHPKFNGETTIVGDFRLPRAIRPHDRLTASFGFYVAKGVPDCHTAGDAYFSAYLLDAERTGAVQLFSERDTGGDAKLRTKVIDLAAYQGARRLRLMVDAGATSHCDWAGWTKVVIRPSL
ncbi:hypothetical protein ACIBI9_57910 [Nonomuraea sp. NPDC050451]|uniref:hypothetical protein n=1 Tax=Nonomuraea sp. NPDC050451 TaxID=3364364 RepID=UPI0037B674BE